MIMVLVLQKDMQTFDAMKSQLDLQSENYLDLSDLIRLDKEVQILLSLISIFMMLSTIYYQANLHFTLKTYTQIVVNFFENAWIASVLIIFLITILAVAWIILMQGSMPRTYDIQFVYACMMKSSFYAGPFEDI